MSRGAAEHLGYDQTPQVSDQGDRDFGIWGDVFLDAVDIHHRGRMPNKYGPVLFAFRLDMLVSPALPPLRITRSNPIHWPEVADNRRYFRSSKDFRAGYQLGDFNAMLTLRVPRTVFDCFDFLESITLDDPRRVSHLRVEYYSAAIGALHSAARAGGVPNPSKLISRRQCREGCTCKGTYRGMAREELWKHFRP